MLLPNGIRATKVLVLRALMLGDMLAAVPALRALRRGLPGAEITVVGLPWAKDLLGRYPYVDRFLEFPGFPGLPEVPWDWDRLREFTGQARAYRYDLVLQMHGDGRLTNAFVHAIGGRLTVGFYESPQSRAFLDLGLPYRRGEHEVLRLLSLLRALGIPPSGTHSEFPIHPYEEAEIDQIEEVRRLHRPIVALHPGSRVPSKRWTVEGFASVARELVLRTGASLVLLGSRDELELVRQVQTVAGVPATNLAGRTSLGGLAALIKRSDLFVGNDSGPAHLAVALNVPSVAIYRQSAVDTWAPLDRSRHRALFARTACVACEMEDGAPSSAIEADSGQPSDLAASVLQHRCVAEVKPEHVVEHAEQLLAARAPASLRLRPSAVVLRAARITGNSSGEQR